MKKRMIITLLFGLAAMGTQQIQTTTHVSDGEKAVASYVGNAIAYVVSNVAGASRDFTNSLLMTGATLPLPWVGRHIEADEKIVKMSNHILLSSWLINSGKSAIEFYDAFEKNNISQGNKVVRQVLQKGAGLLTAMTMEELSVVAYGFAKAAFIKYCCLKLV